MQEKEGEGKVVNLENFIGKVLIRECTVVFSKSGKHSVELYRGEELLYRTDGETSLDALANLMGMLVEIKENAAPKT